MNGIITDTDAAFAEIDFMTSSIGLNAATVYGVMIAVQYHTLKSMLQEPRFALQWTAADNGWNSTKLAHTISISVVANSIFVEFHIVYHKLMKNI